MREKDGRAKGPRDQEGWGAGRGKEKGERGEEKMREREREGAKNLWNL